VIKTLEAQVGQFRLGCKCPVSRSIVVEEQGSFVTFPRRFSFKISFNCTGRDLFQQIFSLGILLDGVSRYAATPLIVALSPSHSDIIRFRPWSRIARGNHLDRAEKIPKFAQTTATVDVFNPRSGIS